MNQLPIFEVLDELKNTLQKNNVVILEAPPGAGKTTVVPISLLEEEWLRGKSILVLEPRRLATRNAATRMASSLNEENGKTIGYRIRFESKISNQTRVEVVTEGIFTRRIQSDPELKNVGLVIFDEFHERNLNTDLGLALALDVQSVLREDLKILIMSATLDGKTLSSFLNAPVVKSEGKAFPIEVRHLNLSKEKLAQSILTAIKKGLADNGDILVFLPGSGEIKRVQKELEENFNLANTLICPLYGELSSKDQEIAIYPDRQGRRKIILSTNIAESSLTIEGVSIVIDSGLSRIPRFDPSTGMTKLITADIAKDSITQRAGRAGRLGPGIAYRIWSKEEEKHFAEKTRPEILETDLSQFLLEVSSWGSNLEDLKLLDMPLESSISRSKALLQNLELLETNGKITDLGKKVMKLPLHPRLGYMVISSQAINELNLASILAALLNEKNIFPVGHFSHRQVNLSLQAEEFLKNPNSFIGKRIKRTSEEIIKICSDEKNIHRNPDLSKIGIVLSFAYPDRIARIREKKSLRYKLSSGKGAVLKENDSLEGSDFLAIAELDGDSKESTIFSAAKINLSEILEFHKHKIKKKQTARIDINTGRISVQEEISIGELVLSSKELQEAVTSELLLDVWKNYIAENGLSVLPWTEEVENFRMRSEFLRSLGENLPPLNEEYLLPNISNWLLPFLSSIRKISELKNINLLTILQSMYTYEQLQVISKEAPDRYEVPSGSNIRLEYKKDEVILSVKIQELFGLLETPSIASGRMKLTLQLLSPSQRPIQTTKDLVGFWDKTYLEVKKELAGRYPKHPWPDNPRLAQATKYTKKRAYST